MRRTGLQRVHKDLEHWGYDPKTLELVSSTTTEEGKVEEKAE
jgi:hypothetical protein